MSGNVIIFAAFIMVVASSIGVQFGVLVTRYVRGVAVRVILGISILLFAVGTILKLLDVLLEKGVTLLTGVRYEAVTAEGLAVMTREGEKKTIEVDTIVLAVGSIPDKKLYEEVKGKVPELHLAGDCVEPRTIREAVADGYRIGLEI